MSLASDAPEGIKGQGGSLILKDPAEARRRIVKTTRKWPAGGIQHWTLPVLKCMAKHYPAAVDRVGQIVRDPGHKDNFAACKLIIETLVRDEHGKKSMMEGANLNITIEMANTPKQEKVIEGEALPALETV